MSRRVGVKVHHEAGVGAVLLADVVGQEEESSSELGHEAQPKSVRTELTRRRKYPEGRDRSTEVETSQRRSSCVTSRIAGSALCGGIASGRVGGVVGDNRLVTGQLPN